jgi:PAS domain-containing protein
VGLRLIVGGADQSGARGGPTAFCGHCGARPRRPPSQAELTSLCEFCSIGVMLETDRAAAPDGDPFVIVDANLEILAVSDRAETLLGMFEQDARGRPITDFMVGSERSLGCTDNFAVAIADSFISQRIELANAMLRGRRGGELTLRIASCTPPRAALVVFTGAQDTVPRLSLADEDAIA